MRKAFINGKSYDVLTYDEYAKDVNNVDNSCAILEGDTLYPIKKQNDNKPGFYTAEGSHIGFFYEPETDEDRETYSSKSVIDFSNVSNTKELIEKSNLLQEKEREMLTNAKNITAPKILPEDEPEMKCFKEALTAKNFDMDKYSDSFGSNYPNDKRLIFKNSMTFSKMKYIAEKVDLKMTLTIEDKNPDVPNPMNKKISYVITGDEDGENNC